MIAIVDYGMGNLGSVRKGFENLGFDARVTSSPAEVRGSAGLVLPGVGAFAAAIRNLRESDLVEPILAHIRSGKPFLGICLGLQMLFERSPEGEGADGLAIFKGDVPRFNVDLKVPHMGWNQVRIKKPGGLFRGVPDGAYFYFVHSYYVAPEDEGIVAGRVTYGQDVVCAIESDNIAAVQFHPEKSQKMGLQLLKNFGETCR